MSALAVCNNVTPVDKGPVTAEIEKNEEVPIRDLARRSSFVGRPASQGNSLDINSMVDDDP